MDVLLACTGNLVEINLFTKELRSVYMLSQVEAPIMDRRFYDVYKWTNTQQRVEDGKIVMTHCAYHPHLFFSQLRTNHFRQPP